MIQTRTIESISIERVLFSSLSIKTVYLDTFEFTFFSIFFGNKLELVRYNIESLKQPNGGKSLLIYSEVLIA